MNYAILLILVSFCFFFFKQKTAYDMRISDWSSDVCSSDLSNRPSIEFRVKEVALCAKFDPRNVAQCNRRSIRIGAQNDIGELFRGCEAALRQNSGVEFRLSCQRKIADLAPWPLAVLLLNRSERFGGGKPVIGNLLRIEPVAHGVGGVGE